MLARSFGLLFHRFSRTVFDDRRVLPRDEIGQYFAVVTVFTAEFTINICRPNDVFFRRLIDEQWLQ